MTHETWNPAVRRRTLVGGLGALAATAAIPGLPGSRPAYADHDYGDIPLARIPPSGWPGKSWDNPFGWATVNVNDRGLRANDSSVNASTKVIDIINETEASGRRVLKFPAGTYYFKSDLAITKSDIRLVGDGKGATIFRIVAPTTERVSIAFKGGPIGGPIPVSGSLSLGAKTITLADASTISVGDFIRLYASTWIIDGTNEVVGQIFKVNGKSGNTITLDMPLGIGIPSDKTPVVQRLNMRKNVGVEKLTVWRLQDNADSSVNIKFAYVFNGRVTQVESKFCANIHLAASFSKKIVFKSNDIHDGYDFGPGGHGYGIAVGFSTTSGLYSNNKIWGLRHHILMRKSANHGVYSFNSLERPIETGGGGGGNALTVHGRYCHNNLIESNFTPHTIEADQAHGENGPRNTFFRNHALDSIGNLYSETDKTNIIGNIMRTLLNAGSMNYVGANRVAGNIKWGELSETSSIPPSLYRDTAPSIFGNRPWPIFGPGVDANWGTGNSLPATDRPQP